MDQADGLLREVRVQMNNVLSILDEREGVPESTVSALSERARRAARKAEEAVENPVTQPEKVSDLAIYKTAEGVFRYGERGRYHIQVCNVGQKEVAEVVEVTEDLDQGVKYISSLGDGWKCSHDGGMVTCEHSNSGGLRPNECLPVLTLQVEVGSTEDISGGSVESCATIEEPGDSNPKNNTVCIENEVREGD
ncbi:MAG: hypothetical protein SV377_05590 [Halobacteria archaeon]|nr:hypothetical protein [Halobacteria archaeon]